MSGLFITFEGTEGAGKSTQVALLAERLRAAGKTVRPLREPGGTPVSEEIRAILKHNAPARSLSPETELLLVNASRAQLVREVIRPALAAGEIVLCDRFFDSTVAYQAYGRGLDPASVNGIISFATGGLVPDLTLLLLVPLALSESRRASRADASDRFEQSGREFFTRVEQGYLALAAAHPRRIRLIDATGSIPSIHEAIWSLVQPSLTR